MGPPVLHSMVGGCGVSFFNFYDAAVAAADDAAVAAADEADEAAAAFWGLEERYVGEYAACPFYLIIFGPWKGFVEFPYPKPTHEVPKWLRDDGFFRDRLLRLRDVPHEHARRRWPDAGAADAAVAVQRLDLGKIRQK